MARHCHHSGYLADDEAGHRTYIAPLPKKPLLPEMGPALKLGHVPHPPSVNQGYWQNPKCPQTFGSFLDFLTEGPVLDSLQSVVEKATEHMATMKTEAGLPLVDVKDPMLEPNVRRGTRARPSFSTVHRHRARPTLCTRRPNNYPSCSSSMSDSHSIIADWLGSHNQGKDPGARGIGSLPPMRDRLLLEKNLKRLLQLENKGKDLNQSCSQKDSLLWDSLGSQTSRQWTREQPLSWFAGLLGSSSGTPEASELGPGEQELIFLKQGLHKEIKSLLSQQVALSLPVYCSHREPHHTLDFLAGNRLFPALQSVVSQAVDKLSKACRHNGFPLFPAASEPTQMLSVNSGLGHDSKAAIPINREDREEHCGSPTTACSTKTSHRKSRSRRGSPTISNAQMATRFRLKVIPTEEPKDLSPSFQATQESPDSDPKLQKPPVVLSSQMAKPRHGLHLTLPAPGITVEVASCQTCLRSPLPHQLASSCPSPSSSLSPMLSSFSSLVSNISPSPTAPCSETISRVGLEVLEKHFQGKSFFSHHT
ncbi:coiled-coil domain-containing protein 116 [Nannospalax galili]|uniref:Coiled-coil domain-containing protein 116 n=1 Tax=Nannospalax galili TaxID=1026970 RepID=A0A8C6QU55_NANGA|nr:coiled-coil domain-containing protein 116 [Nannospalax galili]